MTIRKTTEFGISKTPHRGMGCWVQTKKDPTGIRNLSGLREADFES